METTPILIFASALITALLAGLTATTSHLYRRVDALEIHNRKLWAYTRAVLDLYYRHKADDAPPPPPFPNLEP